MKRAIVAFLLCTPIATYAAVEKGSVDANGTSLYYESRGSGTPVILIEGGNLDLRMWDPQFASFAKHHLVIRYDVRGFGRSGPYGASYRALDDLAGLMDALHIERAHLVGLSLGGRIAIDFALEHPDRVRSLVLSGPGLSGFAWSPTGNEWYEPIAEAAARRDSIGAADAWLESPYMSPAMQDAHLAKRLRVLAHANSRAWVHPETEAQLEPPAGGRLGEIHVPVLLLLGSRDVPDIHAIVDALTVGITQSRRVEFAGAGHMLNLERTADFNRAVLDFIDDVDHR